MQNGDTSKCWHWRGALNAKGRPYFSLNNKKVLAYQLSLELFTGEEAQGRLVRHKCDTPSCCNPHHLEWGTHEENMQDMKERERHGMPKNVRKAWVSLRAQGRSLREIGELYGVSHSAVAQALEKEDKDVER
jgi:hypothetical protein